MVLLVFYLSIEPHYPSTRNANFFSTHPSLYTVTSSSIERQEVDDSCGAACLTVHLYPDGDLYSGDLVTIQVVAPLTAKLGQQKLTVKISSVSTGLSNEQPIIAILGPISFVQSASQDFIANLQWAWDTRHLPPGAYLMDFSIMPAAITWERSVILTAPISNPQHWVQSQSPCCIYEYITGTAAERDLDKIKQSADAQAGSVSSLFKTPFKGLIPIVLVPRVLGQGGFTTDEIYISYLDRDYSSDSLAMILHHEMVHFLDGQSGEDFRPAFLAEGLAVYTTGGHYQPEPFLLTAATLSGQGQYLPFPDLIDSFYDAQHETGYLEAAALIQWMVNQWGWGNFLNFYHDIHPVPDGSQSEAIDQALQNHYHLSLFQVEDHFLNAIHQLPVNPDLNQASRIKVLYYDTVRRYQQVLDPSAYFRDVWLLDEGEMARRDIVGDYLRHPDIVVNQTLELLLINARRALVNENYAEAIQIIQSINIALDRFSSQNGRLRSDQGLDQAFIQSSGGNPITASMAGAVQALDACGYEPQLVTLNQKVGQAEVISTWPTLMIINLTYQQAWSADCLKH